MKDILQLKKCPFCGGKATHKKDNDTGSLNFDGEWIECENCKSSTSIMFPVMGSVKELLYEKWNNRAKVNS